MKHLFAPIIAAVLIFVATPVNADVSAENVLIHNVFSGENGVPMYFTLSDGLICFVKQEDKLMTTLVMSAFAAGWTVRVECTESTRPFAEVEGHRLKKIIVTR